VSKLTSINSGRSEISPETISFLIFTCSLPPPITPGELPTTFTGNAIDIGLSASTS